MNEEKTAIVKTESETPEVVNVTALERIEHATIDCQIQTAHAFPRSMTIFKKRATEMVTLDEETAQSCIYRRPVGKKGDKIEYAEGKSIRMAEIVGACYGNLRVGSILIEQTPRYVKARGMAHDLESNFAASSEVVESTVNKYGEPFSERMRMVVAKATLAKARRDATFQVVPGALCKSLEDAARKTAIGTTATIGKRRAVLLDWLNKSTIEPDRVWKALGIVGIDDIGLKELETLTGIKTAIKDGDVTIDEAFPKIILEPKKPIFRAQSSMLPQPENLPEEDKLPIDELTEEKPLPDTIEKIHQSFADEGLPQGALLTLLRKDGILKEHEGLEDLNEKNAEIVIKTIDAYIGRARQVKK